MRLNDAFLAMKNQKNRNSAKRTGKTEAPDCDLQGRRKAEEGGKESEERPENRNCLSTVWSEQSEEGMVPSEYPRPQFQREEWTNLNGYWEYAFTDRTGRPEQFDGKILVPFSPESRRSGVEKRLEPGGYLWYRRSVMVEKQQCRRLILHFGAVDQKCALWWNGKCIGTHENAYLPFSFDVTDVLQEGENTLWVRVQDDSDRGNGCRGKQTLHPGGMFYTAQSGIWQTVWMEWVPEKRIDSLKITPLYDEAKVRAEVRLTVPMDVKISISGIEEACIDAEIAGAKFCVSGTDNRLSAVIDIPIPGFRSWSPESPFLYDMTVRSGEDCVYSYFAMRKFSAGMDNQQHPRLMLNNEPYFFNGILDQGYWPETLLTPPSDEAMIFDIEQMKHLGFNMLRKHIKIEPLRWYYHCDRIGMVVWQDMVNGGGPIRLPLVCYLPTVIPTVGTKIRDSWYSFFARTDKISRVQWEKDCMETVRLLYNCPCISLWVPFNEGWGQFDSIRITELIRKEDPTRMIDHASGWFDQGGGDVKSVHNYFRPLKAEKDARPFVLSEYGGYVCPIEDHLYCKKSYGYKAYKSREEFTAAFRTLQKQIDALVPEGLCAAVYTQVSDIEEEINGLYTYDRKVCKVLDA